MGKESNTSPYKGRGMRDSVPLVLDAVITALLAAVVWLVFKEYPEALDWLVLLVF